MGGRNLTDEKPTKTEQLNAAGISTATANRYEELTGGKEEQAQAIATAAAESYFANQQENNELSFDEWPQNGRAWSIDQGFW
jgi:hypothetical protein